MKKVILCSLLAAVLAFTACGKTEAPDAATDGTLSAEVTTTVADTTKATEATTAEEVTEATTEASEPTAEETTAPEESNESDQGDSKAADDFMNIMNGKKVYMEASSEADGMSVNMIMAIDMTGEKQNTYMNMDLMGFKIVMLTNEKGSFLIDDESKIYYTSDGNNSTDMSNETFATQSFKKTGTGVGKVDGADCGYVKYDVVDTDGENCVYKVYYKGGKVVAIEVDDDGAIVKIKKYSSEIPAGMFSIPAGYTEKNASEMFSFGN